MVGIYSVGRGDSKAMRGSAASVTGTVFLRSSMSIKQNQNGGECKLKQWSLI